jgi:hypothetical protein
VDESAEKGKRPPMRPHYELQCGKISSLAPINLYINSYYFMDLLLWINRICADFINRDFEFVIYQKEK